MSFLTHKQRWRKCPRRRHPEDGEEGNTYISVDSFSPKMEERRPWANRTQSENHFGTSNTAGPRKSMSTGELSESIDSKSSARKSQDFFLPWDPRFWQSTPSASPAIEAHKNVTSNDSARARRAVVHLGHGKDASGPATLRSSLRRKSDSSLAELGQLQSCLSRPHPGVRHHRVRLDPCVHVVLVPSRKDCEKPESIWWSVDDITQFRSRAVSLWNLHGKCGKIPMESDLEKCHGSPVASPRKKSLSPPRQQRPKGPREALGGEESDSSDSSPEKVEGSDVDSDVSVGQRTEDQEEEPSTDASPPTASVAPSYADCQLDDDSATSVSFESEPIPRSVSPIDLAAARAILHAESIESIDSSADSSRDGEAEEEDDDSVTDDVPPRAVSPIQVLRTRDSLRIRAVSNGLAGYHASKPEHPKASPLWVAGAKAPHGLSELSVEEDCRADPMFSGVTADLSSDEVGAY